MIHKSGHAQEETIVSKWKQKCTSDSKHKENKKRKKTQLTNPTKQNKKPKLELKITQNIKQLIFKKNLKKTRMLQSRGK